MARKKYEADGEQKHGNQNDQQEQVQVQHAPIVSSRLTPLRNFG